MSDIMVEKFFEDQPIPVPIEGAEKILFQMKNCICKIHQEDGKKGTGFFCKMPILNNKLPVLITNNHLLGENDIKNGKIIKLTINNDIKEIKLDNSRKKFTNEEKDITIIEIESNKDEIYNYLEFDENDLYKNKENIELEYQNKSIYILHYPKGKLNVSYSIIKKIENNVEIYHCCNTEPGSSGGPILSLEAFKVIGIHCGAHKIEEYNFGIFFKYAIDLFKKYINYKNGNDIKQKIDINIYPLNSNVESKKMNKPETNISKEKPPFPLCCNGEINDKINFYHRKECKAELNKFNLFHVINNDININNLYHDKNANKNIEVKYNNHREAINSSSVLITDKNSSKEFNRNSRYIKERKPSICYIMENRENIFSVIDSNCQLNSKFCKGGEILYDKNKKYRKNNILNKSKEFSFDLLDNNRYIDSIELSKNIEQDKESEIIPILKVKKNDILYNESNRRKNSLKFRKKNIKLYDIKDDIENEKVNNNLVSGFSTNRNRYLNERNNLKEEESIKNINGKKRIIYKKKPQKFGKNINNLNSIIQNCDNKNSGYSIEKNNIKEDNKLHYRTQENFENNIKNKKLTHNEKTLILDKVNNSKKISFKQRNISINNLSFNYTNSDIKEKIDESKNNNLMASQDCINFNYNINIGKIYDTKKIKNNYQNDSFYGNKSGIIHKELKNKDDNILKKDSVSNFDGKENSEIIIRKVKSTFKKLIKEEKSKNLLAFQKKKLFNDNLHKFKK